ncbi:Auxin-induced protein X15 [Apostasia shenzhenica]|uniref:Auxin-induced protein X15 n=1 Tax=Apostasia shenzhenica TaxID=1088818 RepID=A0A2I0BEU0_9ASPA|nr:Auxin-induced protein X15 [Apostasia shenzhenica]
MKGERQQQQQQHGMLGLGFQRGLKQREGAAAALPPKGWMAIRVGEEGAEQQRFIVPVGYLNHPLFVGLLKAAEEEYGFAQKGAITIPCQVEYFHRVQSIIDRDNNTGGGGSYHHLLLHLCFHA